MTENDAMDSAGGGAYVGHQVETDCTIRKCTSYSFLCMAWPLALHCVIENCAVETLADFISAQHSGIHLNSDAFHIYITLHVVI